MFKIEIDLDDLTPEGLDKVASVIFDGKDEKYTTDWSVTGPIIEKLGIDLGYSAPDEKEDPAISALKSRLGQEDQSWTASYRGEYETHSKPLIAAIKALVRSWIGDRGVPIPSHLLYKYVEDQRLITDALLESSIYHTVEPSIEDVNILTR